MRVFLDGGARQWNEEFNQPREAATA